MSAVLMMCPHCGALLDVEHLTPFHAIDGETCPGSRQIPRCAESDARPLWNGKRNRHFRAAGAVAEEHPT